MKGKYDPLEDFEAKILVDTHAENIQNETNVEAAQKQDETNEGKEPAVEQTEANPKQKEVKKAEKQEKADKKSKKKDKKKVNITLTKDEVENIEEDKAPATVEKAGPEEGSEAQTETKNSLEELNLNEKLVQKLTENGYTKVEDIVNAGPEELLKIKGMGKEELAAIVEALKSLDPNLDNQTTEDGK
jgi:hypothetical protein